MEQSYNKNSQKDQLKYFQEQTIKLSEKLTLSQKKIKQFQKLQIKVKELQKTNFETSTRLLQCVSNVRDLLHSNKQLRSELQKQKIARKNGQKRVTELQKIISALKRDKELPLEKVIQTNQQKDFTVKKPRNIHKLSKIQKFSKLKQCSQRCSTDNMQKFDSSPNKNSQEIIKNLNKIKVISTYQSSHQLQIWPQKNKKFFKSVDEKLQQKNYEKAQLKRKLSLRKSQNRLETLQYRP